MRASRVCAALAVALVVLLALAGGAAAVVSIGKAELQDGRLRIEGSRAVANAAIRVDGVEMGRADGAGDFRIERSGFSDADCVVGVDDGTGSVRATLSGCSPSSGEPEPAPQPEPEPAPSPSPSSGPSFQGLGVLPNSDQSFGNDVSADGSTVVGWVPLLTGGYRAWRWTASGGLQDIGDLGGGHARANAVSSDGSVIVGVSFSDGEHGFRLVAGQPMQQLPMADAWDVSGDGKTVVAYAIYWNETTGKQFLPSFSGPSGGITFAHAVSDDGSVVTGFSVKPDCNFQFGPSCNRAFRWSGGTAMTDLGHLGGVESIGRGMNATGSVIVGESRNKDGWWRAFRWNGSMSELGTLGGPMSAAYDASADGSVITGKSLTSSSSASETAFRWTSRKKMQDLRRELLDAGVSSVSGWLLKSANAVSRDGTVIVGTGLNPSRRMEAFRAVLPLPR